MNIFGPNILAFISAIFKIKFFLIILLAYCLIQIIINKKNITSSNRKKLKFIHILSLFNGIFLSYLIYLILGVNYIHTSTILFFLIKINSFWIDYIVLTIISYEFFYQFYYLKEKITLLNLKPYLLLILGIIILYKFTIFNYLINLIFNFIYYIYFFNFLKKQQNSLTII